MFKNFSRLFRFPTSSTWRPVFACSLASLAYMTFQPQIKLDDHVSLEEELPQLIKDGKLLNEINIKYICPSSKIKQGDIYFTYIQEKKKQQTQQIQKYLVALSRVNGKIYAVAGFCSYSDPLDNVDFTKNTFEDAIIFGDKLLCPHHGCAFNIQTGTVEFGPAYKNLPRYFVEEIDDKVNIHYPSKLPKRIRPKTEPRDLNDDKKVVILGNDYNSMIGCIHSLKQYDYGGQINVLSTDGQTCLPYRKDLLHHIVPNFKQLLKKKIMKDFEFQEMLEEKVYSKLQYHNQIWYKAHGIEFNPVDNFYRIINKRFYPYVKSSDGTKHEFDGILIAEGVMPKIERLENITCLPQSGKPREVEEARLAPNVFMPFHNKKESKRLIKYLNRSKVDSLFILGINPESLEFGAALNNSFPDIKLKYLDIEQENTLLQMFGPDISNQILKQYSKKGIEFFVQIQDLPQLITNHFRVKEKNKTEEIQGKIILKFDQKNSAQANGMVYFPNEYVGNSESMRMSKYVDVDYDLNNHRIIVNPYSRTDTKRIFAAGGCSSLEFFFTRNRINLINNLVSYEQGFISAFNIMALKIPFYYIPVEIHKFMSKKIYYAGARKRFDSMYIIGDVKSWDFIALYAQQDEIKAASASPSRQKQFQVLREAFRLECCPTLTEMVQQEWNIPQIYKLIRKINKSSCYKYEIHQLDDSMNIPDVIWMQRQKGSFKSESKLSEDESNIQVDRRGYVTQV